MRTGTGRRRPRTTTTRHNPCLYLWAVFSWHGMALGSQSHHLVATCFAGQFLGCRCYPLQRCRRQRQTSGVLQPPDHDPHRRDVVAVPIRNCQPWSASSPGTSPHFPVSGADAWPSAVTQSWWTGSRASRRHRAAVHPTTKRGARQVSESAARRSRPGCPATHSPRSGLSG